MSAEAITAELLNVAGVTSLVGGNVALGELPVSATYPAIVYELVSDAPLWVINASAGPQLLESRVQVTALAADSTTVESVMSAVLTAMNLKSGTIAGKMVASVVEDIRGPWRRDPEAEVWEASRDFIIIWYR